MSKLCAGRTHNWGEYTLAELVFVSDQLRNTPNPSLRELRRLDRLEDEIAANYHRAPAPTTPTTPPSLTVAAHQIVWLDEAEFYAFYGDAHLYSEDHYQGTEVLDWARDRHDRDAVKLASEASRPILHKHICHVTGVSPNILHIQGGVATLDDGRQVLESRLPHWADPQGRARDHHTVAHEIESSTYSEFRRWLERFADGAIVGWDGRGDDCVMHRFYRQRTGVRWDCLCIDLDTASVESEYSYDKTTARLPAFAEFVSRVTTGNAGNLLADNAPTTAGWLRENLSDDNKLYNAL